MSRILRATEQLEDDVTKANVFVHGGEDATYTAKDGAKVRSIRNLQREAEVNIGEAKKHSIEAEEGAKKAEDAVKRSEAASTVAQISAELYPNTQIGLDSTKDGEYFSVVSEDDNSFVLLIRNSNGVAEEIKQYPSSEYVVSKDKKVRADVVRQFVPQNSFSIPGVLLSIVDAVNNRTWLEANDQDGGPSDLSQMLFENKIGYQFQNREEVNCGLLFAITDATGVATDLCLDEKGQFPDFVIESLKRRMYQNDVIAYNPFSQDKKYDIGVYGSSTLQWLHTAIEREFDSLTIKKKAKGGALIESVLFRIGLNSQMHIMSDFKAPADKIVAELNYDNDSRFVDTNIADNYGNIFNLSFSNGQYYLQLLNSQQQQYGYLPKKTDGFIPAFTDGLDCRFMIFNAGKNNISRTTDMSVVGDLFDAHLKLSDFLLSNNTRYLFLGNFSNTNYSDIRVSIVEKLNKKLRQRFGNYFLDVNDVLFADKTWADLEITKTEADLEAIQKRVLPPSLSRDSGHLSDQFNDYFAALLKEKYDLLNFKGE